MTSAGFKSLFICAPVSRAEGVRSLGLELWVLWVLGTGVQILCKSSLTSEPFPTLTPVFTYLS